MIERHIAAIDLGSSKFAVTVARISGDDIQIVYYKESPSDGIRNSYVFNPMRAEQALRTAIAGAESELGIKILQVVVGYPRYPVMQEVATGRFERTDPNECITFEEVEALKSIALESYPLEDEKRQEIYGAVAQSFSTDDYFQLVEDDVVGMVSAELEGNFKVFIGDKRKADAIDVVFNKLGIAVAKKYFIPDVTARAVLSHEETESGVALIDFGGGSTSVSIYQGGIMRHYTAIPFGGNAVTRDIKTECGISSSLAENIKKAYGACIPGKLPTLGDKIIQIRYADRNAVAVKVDYLSEVIGARMKEIIDAILWAIDRSGFADSLRSGIVITGGGSALLGCAMLLKEMSGFNVKVGYPRHFFSAEGCPGVREASAAASMGMILSAKNDRLPDCVDAPIIRREDIIRDIFSGFRSEEVETVEEEPVTVDAYEEPAVEPGTIVPDEFHGGTTGTLIPEEEFGEAVKKPRPPKKQTKVHILWKKISKSVGESLAGLTEAAEQGFDKL